jgi:hypothetical protein
MKNTLMTSFVEAFKGINDPLLVITSRLREAFGSQEFIHAIQGIATALAELALTVVENADKIGMLVVAILGFKAVMWVIGMVKGLVLGLVLGLEAMQVALAASRVAVIGLYASLGLIGVALGIAAAAWAYYNAQKDSATGEKQRAALNTLDQYVKSLTSEAERMEEVNRQMMTGKTLREAETAATEEGAIALARLNKLKAEEAARSRVQSAQKEYDDAKPNAWQINGEQTYGRAKAKMELDAANANLKQVETQTNAALAGVEVAIQRARAAARAQAAMQEAQANADREKARANAGTGTLPDKADKAAAKSLAAELLSLDKLTAGYKARADAMQQMSDTGIKAMAGVHQAQVQAEIDDGKYSATAAAKLMAHAKAADAAKFEVDGLVALSDLSQKIARQHEIELSGLAEANAGHTKLTGALEAETLQMLKLWNVAPDGAYAKRLLAEARATDEATAAKERALKFNKGTEEITQQAASHFEAGDALRDYGKAGKQTAIELAQLKVVQDGINPVTQTAIINNRMAAAGMLDLGVAYENLYKITNALKEANDKSEADQVDAVLTNEQAKVMVKREASLKAIEFSTQQAEAARALAVLEGRYGDDQIAAYNKVMSARGAAMAQLDASTKNGLQAARSKDLTALVEESKTLGSTLESAFGGAGKAIGGMVTAMAELQKSQEDYNNTLGLAAKERAKGNGVRASEMEAEASKKSAKAQVKSYADMLGASKNFFKEGSTGYKILGAAEKAFRLAEMAMAYEAMIRKIFFTEATTTAAVVGNEVSAASAVTSATVESGANMAKATTSAVAAVANQGSGDPYTAFFRIAAMAAIMAGLGLAVGGGGGGSVSHDTSKERQAQQGTGTVLGDETAKSESIAKSIELLSSNSDIALKYTSSMLTTLRSIRDGIAGMAAFVSQSTGLRGTTADQRALGVGSSKSFLGFSSDSTELTDSGISFDRVVTNQPPATTEEEWAQQGMDGGYWNTVLRMMHPETRPQTIGDALGGGVQAQGYSDLHKESSSWWGLSHDSSDESQFSALDPALKASMTRSIGAMFNGALEAAVSLGGKDRGTLETMLNALTLDDVGLTKISLKGLSGSDIEKELEAAFSKVGDVMAKTIMPGLDEFQKVGEGYFQTLVRVSSGVDVAKYAMEKLGLTAVAYTDVLNKQGDVATEIVRDSIVKAESTIKPASEELKASMRLLLGPVISEAANNFEDLTTALTSGIGDIIATMDGTVEDLTDVYKTLTKLRDQFNASGMDGSTISREMVRGAGGLDSLSSGAASYFQNFYSENEQSQAAVKLLTDEIAALGVAVPQTKDEFRALVQAANNGTEAGDWLVGKLMSLADVFNTTADTAYALAGRMKEASDMMNATGLTGSALNDNTISGAGDLDNLNSGLSDFFGLFTDEQQIATRISMMRAQFEALGVTVPYTKEAFIALVDAADAAGNQTLVGKLLSMAGAFGTLYDNATSAAKAISDKAFQTAMTAVDRAFARLRQSVDNEKKLATAAYNAEVKAIKAKADADTKAAKDLLPAAQEALKSVQTIFEAIKSAIKSTQVDSAALSAARRKEAQNTLNGALTRSRAGGSLVGYTGLTDALETIQKPSEDLFKSFTDYARDQALTANTLTGLAGTAEKEVDKAQLTIDAINGTIDAIKVAADAQLEALATSHQEDLDRLDGILSQAQLQIDALNGIDSSLLSLTAAMSNFATAVLNAQAAKAATATATASAGARPSAGTGTSAYQRLVDNGNGSATAYFAGGGTHTVTDPNAYALLAATYRPAFADGTNWLPEDMTADIHEGERIIPKADNIELMKRLKEPAGGPEAEREAMRAAIEDLKRTIQAGDVANVQRTVELVKLFKRWDSDGMPDTRIVE